MKTSLIVTTYNWPEALSLVLKSVIAQSVIPDEIIIADDGSREETAQAIKDVLRGKDVKWKHVCHADQGVRQSRIKNLAVKHSSGDYLIFVDHDVVLHPAFIEDHLSMACEGVFLQGKRVLLSKGFTEEVVASGIFRQPSPWAKEIENRKNGVHFSKLGKLLSLPKSFEESLRGCNLSMFRDDFLKVDGFDETFDGSWGREDSDICYRLFHAGVLVRVLWFMALQYHLYHGKVAKWDRERLDPELQSVLEGKRVRALKGFAALSSEGGVIE
jgi:glycosyltransferase involved in cell wall biosynthesis